MAFWVWEAMAFWAWETVAYFSDRAGDDYFASTPPWDFVAYGRRERVSWEILPDSLRAWVLGFLLPHWHLG